MKSSYAFSVISDEENPYVINVVSFFWGRLFNVYGYQGNGKGKLVSIEDKINKKTRNFYYDARGRIDRYSQDSVNYKYSYDNYGNVISKKAGETLLYSCTWKRGNLLNQITTGNATINYEYNHRCVRFKKSVGGVTTDYYLDGAKILGESRSDGKELRYFYDHDGLMGFKYNGMYYGYVKDGQDNIVAIVNQYGNLVAQYEYDSFGRTTVKDAGGDVTTTNSIGNINPFRWKSFYYDVETGFYYANGRYYEAERGGYIDAIEADIIEGNAYNVLGLDRNGIMLLTLLMLAPYSATIATALELYADPTYDPKEGVEEEDTTKKWWKKHWWEVVTAAVSIVVGVAMLVTGNVAGVLSIISGVCTLVGAIFSEQLAGAMGTATLGVQTIMIGVQSLSCSSLYGIIAIAVGAVCVAFATAEAQEALGYGNWLKDTVGMSDEVYAGVMLAANMAAIAINIVGVKQCFKEGTLVACLNENGEEVRKPIESIAVGTLVLAYDEETGEKAYKPVVRLSRNTTKEWYHIFVNGEEVVCTSGHPFYVLNADNSRNIVCYKGSNSNTKGSWVTAKELRISDKLLLSDGTYAIINSIEIETLESPETTYNFEVEDFHTYYVSETNVLIHNSCQYFEATRTENGVKRGRQITKKEALNRVRNGKDVMTNSKASAKSLMKNAFGNRKGYSEIHESLINPMAHFHDANNHIYHIFFGNNFI